MYTAAFKLTHTTVREFTDFHSTVTNWSERREDEQSEHFYLITTQSSGRKCKLNFRQILRVKVINSRQRYDDGFGA